MSDLRALSTELSRGRLTPESTAVSGLTAVVVVCRPANQQSCLRGEFNPASSRNFNLASQKKKKRTRGAILAGHFGRHRQDRVGLLVLAGRKPRLGQSFGGCRSHGSGSSGRSDVDICSTCTTHNQEDFECFFFRQCEALSTLQNSPHPQ